MLDLKSELLKNFRCEVLPESYLFLQGADAESLFFILSGFVVLCNGEWEKENYVNFVGAGEVLGEHLFWAERSSKRLYSAKAITSVQCVQLTLDDIKNIKATQLELYLALLELSGKIVHQRLMRANSLIHCFKCEKKTERLMSLIVYLADAFGRKTEKGYEVFFPPELFKFYMNIPQEDFQHCIQSLVEQKILKPIANHQFLLTDKTLLQMRLPQIVDQLASFPIV